MKTVSEIATRAAMSPRQFHRRFRDTTGRSPITWLHEQRIARSKELLETTDLTVETGVFGARMKVELLNDGPVTFILDSQGQ